MNNFEWEVLTDQDVSRSNLRGMIIRTQRLKVEGGYLYQVVAMILTYAGNDNNVSTSLCFVPDLATTQYNDPLLGVCHE